MAVQMAAAERGWTRRPAARMARTIEVATAAALAAGLLGCANGATDQGKLPPEVADPGVVRTPAGAIARYRGAWFTFGKMLDRFTVTTAVMTDEMAGLPAPLGKSGPYTGIDSRTDFEAFQEDYNRLHAVRAEAREARGFLTSYAPDSSGALTGY